VSTVLGGPSVIAGIDVGGTGTKVLLTDLSLRVLDRVDVPTPAHDGGAVIVSTALDAVDGLLERTGGRLVGVGVGAAGVVDARSGTVLVTGNSFTGWAGFGVTTAISARTGVPARLENDVNAFLRGEVVAGAARGERDVFGMTLGTGVGGALYLDGELYDGPHGAAGEIGHVPGFGDAPCTCGQSGHLETIAAAKGISARYSDRTGRSLSAEALSVAALDGDQDAVAVFEQAGRGLARAILVTAGILDLSTVVIGGGVSAGWDLFAPSMLAAVADEPPVSGAPVTVSPAQLGPDAVAIGAASLVPAML
jgi:glucokinase